MKLGFIISNLGANQLAYFLLYEARKYLQYNVGDDFIVFYQNVVKTWTLPVFALMNISELYNYNGVVVATDLHTANKLIHCPGPAMRYFYVWDLEWIRPHIIRSYENLSAVYNNQRVQLLARSQDHAKIIEDAWNRPVRAVIENCRLSTLFDIVKIDAKK